MINIIKPIKKMLSINQIGVSVNVVLTVPRSKFLYKLLHTYLAKNIITANVSQIQITSINFFDKPERAFVNIFTLIKLFSRNA